jgi:hypothetical protein
VDRVLVAGRAIFFKLELAFKRFLSAGIEIKALARRAAEPAKIFSEFSLSHSDFVQR